jgi:predicted nucleic acid-binding protein
MPDAWDTTVASRVHVGSRHTHLLEAHLRTRTPLALPAPAVQEVARGLALRASRDVAATSRFNWFAALLSHPLVHVLPLGDAAAVLAGRLLATVPHPPTGRRREGPRARQRAAWALDVQIASCAFAGGYGVLTENVGDFAALRDEIARLVPGVPPLVVRDACELADLPDQPATGDSVPTGPSTRSA